MIFGGVIPASQTAIEDAEEGGANQDPQTQALVDYGTKVCLTAQSLILDVTVGSIKSGPELAAPSYFISGGYKMLQ